MNIKEKIFEKRLGMLLNEAKWFMEKYPGQENRLFAEIALLTNNKSALQQPQESRSLQCKCGETVITVGENITLFIPYLSGHCVKCGGTFVFDKVSAEAEEED